MGRRPTGASPAPAGAGTAAAGSAGPGPAWAPVAGGGPRCGPGRRGPAVGCRPGWRARRCHRTSRSRLATA
jgi:hypothetical protein